MKLLFQEAQQAENLYRLILDNALDAFIAIDQQSQILDWSVQAEKTFGWSKQEVLGRPLADTIIPQRYRAAHLEGVRRYLAHGSGRFLNRRVEISACHKDQHEIPVELAVTPIRTSERVIFFASLRDISERRALEDEVRRQANITRSIIDSMAAAVAVADPSGQLVLVNPAAQRLLHLEPADHAPEQFFHSFRLLQPDGRTEYPESERPMARALRGEAVDGFLALVCHDASPDDVWVSCNARPLVDERGAPAGGVVVFHDVTELRRRAEESALQARRLQEQASLLDLAHDAIMVRTMDDVITYWNRSAEKLYGYSKDEATGTVSHVLLKTRFPTPLERIRANMREQHYWEGELIHFSKAGKEVVVFSQWALEVNESGPSRYLEINTDITQARQTERALRESQQDFRALVEASTDYAIVMMDPDGGILSWNSGAQIMFGFSAQEAVGQNAARLFTPEDREGGEPQHELDEARNVGRAEDERWHLRRDGTRFWAAGVVTPLWHDDGTLRGFVKIMRDQTRRHLDEEQTQFLANHDGLTGLPNRVYFSNQLHKAIALSERNDVPLAVLLLDLDRFKQVNDTLGHHAGDLLLKEVALRILSSVRETDFVARLGGDEFVIIQKDVTQPDASETLARKLILEMGRPYQIDSHEVISGTSIGISLYPGDAHNSVDLIKRADLALYRAKSAGRHTYQFYTPDLFAAQAWKKDREAALRSALLHDQFELHYLPQVELDSWKISTVEALLRWKATEMELVLPQDFLDIAEDSGLIVEIGEWVLRRACRQLREWQLHGLSELSLSINCSARQFRDPKFVTKIPSIADDAGVAYSSLELEVPEALLAQHPEIKAQLTELRALGMRVTIDNFGTGATALVDLKDFQIDALKIDKAFVQHLPHRREDSAIASAIISLAHNLGIKVGAGGVETAEQLAYLKARDCTSAQGFIFSPPLPADKIEELMLTGSWSRINRWGGSEAAGVPDLH
ncbi:sensor domain-containing protein [Noviherbaspirillum autotrophicum]|uniref:sensor domain-containing protein n=1 Tax=Noviherbaspirillum autotrophicum TaxID=709839 RepID=UPI0006948EC8|nr:PAS domain S-box protein [Noviherbaspirillum autotrophicum]